jgi:hypothetical protein
VAIKVQYTNDARVFNGVKCAVYGRSGAGKTRLAGTGPRPFIFSAESGLLSLRKERIPYTVIKTLKELEDAREWALKSSEARNFDTLSLDSVSEIAEVLLASEKEKTRDPRKAYGELSTKVIEVLRDFRDMPQKHVLFIAKEEQLEVNGARVARPSFPGQQLSQQMPYFFDEVFQIVPFEDPATKAWSAALKTRTDQYSEAKDRSGALDLWEPPNLTHIFNKIMAA